MSSNEVLLEKINNLSEKVDEGFKGVNNRLDTTNGKVLRNTDWRIAQEAVSKKRTKDWDNFKWLFGFVGIGTLANIIISLSKLFP